MMDNRHERKSGMEAEFIWGFEHCHAGSKIIGVGVRGLFYYSFIRCRGARG